jgi:hypothetical protein
MRLTNVENLARRLPTRATLPTNPNNSTEGNINAAHLTDAPPGTVRGSGQGPHARLIYRLTSTTEKPASARGEQIVTDRRRLRGQCKPDFTSPRVAKPPSRLI